MNPSVALSLDDICDCTLLPAQYYELRFRRVPLRGEYLLLWAVLEDAIRIYLANRGCLTSNQRKEFEEVYNWFYPAEGKSHSLFAFHTICDLLGIESQLFLRGLESIHETNLPRRRYRIVSSAGTIRCLAARGHPPKDGSYRLHGNGVAVDQARLSAACRPQQVTDGGLR